MIDVAFIWHMHQPYYKDDLKGLYVLPWVRLHGVKDYYPMAAILERFEGAKAVFNMVPVMVEQINDYANNNASDAFLEVTARRPADLTLSERVYLLNNFFKVNFKRFIEPNGRYRDLLIKRGVEKLTPAAMRRAAAGFSDSDIRDLQALFNLAWFHSITVESDPNHKYIIDKAEGYTEEDKEYIVKKQRSVLAGIIPLYRKLEDAGRIEITTTPYYHPIMPLVCDTNIARVSMPEAELPKPRFSHPADARWHVESAMRYHAENFGRLPRGMWPSEGSVSEEVLDILMGAGLDWVATDEDILFQTLGKYDRAYRGREMDRRMVYQPYRFEKESRHINLVFRDKNLSNLISFAYADWDPQMAALDLLDHFHKISENMRRSSDRGLVAIVMDGENAWEYFEDNGRKFFELLYSSLAEGDEVVSNTVSGFLKEEPARKTMKHLFPGSWIEHNFKIWIGSPQDNTAWQYLARTRRDLVAFTKGADSKAPHAVSGVEKAWREIYIAQGSDWNWWYGPEHSLGSDNPFDPLFRMHLSNVYRFIRKPIPDYLKKPIV